jgi:REP element-mobilizing transposase RayT
MFAAGYKIRDQQSKYFLTFTVVEWVDVFTRSIYADMIIDSLKYCQEHKGLTIYAWCLMSNHLHLVCSVDESNRLSDVVRDFKKYTSVNIIKAIISNDRESRRDWMLWIFKSAGEQNSRNIKYQFWQQDSHPVECYSNELLETRIRYIHQNPIRAGLVLDEWSYRYSSGIDYFSNQKGLIEVVI